eukprot:EG_transcript_27808
MGLPLPKAPQSAVLASALAELQAHHHRSLRAATATATAPVAPSAAPAPLPPAVQQRPQATAAASFVVRDSAFAPFYALLRREHHSGPRLAAPCVPPVPCAPAPSPAHPLDLHYAHNPYSFDGPVWLAPSVSTPSFIGAAFNCRPIAM